MARAALIACAAWLIIVLPLVAAGGVRVDPKTQQLLDVHGRVRVFHGVNAVYKLPPFYPELTTFNTHTSLCPEDMANLESWGVNVVRLGVMWRPVEETQGSYNATYLGVMRGITDDLAKYGIWTLVDSHQDVMSNYFCGEGFPAWAVDTLMNGTDGHWYSQFPSPLPYDLHKVNNFPNLTLCQEHAFFEYYLTVAPNTAFQSLYSMPAMHAAFAGYWNAVAAAFNSSDTVVGYELLNEPWPGDVYEDPLWFLEAGKLDNTNLMPLYEATYAAVRKADADTVVFYEPGVTWSYLGQDFDFASGPGGPGDNDKYVRQALAFHLYCIFQKSDGDPTNITQCEQELASNYALAERSVQKTGGGSMITEFGAVGPGEASAEAIGKVAELADTHTQSWAYWTFKSFHDITTQNSNTESFYNANGTLQMRKVKAIARTYAQAIAGMPDSIVTTFDPDTALFKLQYAHNAAATAPTVIYYSTEYYYPQGYNATVSPASVSLQPSAANDPYHLDVVLSEALPQGTTINIAIAPR